MLKLHLIF